MHVITVDSTILGRIRDLACYVMDGGRLDREQAMWLFRLQEQDHIWELLLNARRIREAFRGNRVFLCSIVNVKSGACPEDCRFCAQSARYHTAAPKYDLVGPEQVLAAARDAHANGAVALAPVAAWPKLTSARVRAITPILSALRDSVPVEVHASLGMIETEAVAAALAEAGVRCYNHNLETSRRYFPNICTTHSYDARVRTIRILKNVGLRVCSGGILGLGETPEDRCELALALRELDVDVVPINILTPIPGTPLEGVPPPTPMEVLKTIACFRFILPRQEITVAGGRPGGLRDLQCMVFLAGASALMIGNYLTTGNRPAVQDLQMLRDMGLEPRQAGIGPGAV